MKKVILLLLGIMLITLTYSQTKGAYVECKGMNIYIQKWDIYRVTDITPWDTTYYTRIILGVEDNYVKYVYSSKFPLPKNFEFTEGILIVNAKYAYWLKPRYLIYRGNRKNKNRFIK